MKRVRKLLIIVSIAMLLFSIFNIGRVLAGIDAIKVTSAAISDKSETVEASISEFNSSSIKTNVIYHKLNDYVTFRLTIKNNDSKKYTIKTITDNNTNGNLLYEYDKHENEAFNSNEEKELLIKSTYISEVTNMNKRDVTNNVKFTITLIDEDGKEEDKDIDIIINPITGDDIGIYIVTGITSLLGLIILTVRKNKKINKSLLVLMLMIPFITKAATLNYDFLFKESIKFHDKLLVTIDVNGEKEERTIPYEGTVTKPADPIKDGYNFLGWFKDDEEYDFTKPVKDDITIKAKYSLIEYNITYNLDGGELETGKTNPSKYTVEDNITLNNPKKTGYNFSGWTGTNMDTLHTTVTISNSTGDLDFVAHYSESPNTTYKVIHKYKNLDGTTEDVTVTETGTTGSTVTASIIHKDGFVDPVETTITITPDGEASHTYIYEREEYSFNITDPEYVTSSHVSGNYPFETVITLTANPREGYTFNGWDDGVDTNPREITLTGNKTVGPTYSPKTNTPYKIIHKYKNLNGTTEDEIVNGTGTTDTTIPAPIKHKDGFIDPTETTITITGNGQASVEYTYEREEYTFNITDRTYVETGSTANGNYPFETEISVTAKTREGYSFKWSDNDTNYTKKFEITEDTTLSLIYTINTYEVKFDKNDSLATGTMSNQEFEYNESKALTENAFIKPTYKFKEWNTKADGSGTSYSDKEVVSNLATSGVVTLYAQWEEDKITITFDTDGGSAVAPMEILRGDQIGTLPTTEKPGSVFVGWFVNITDTNPIDETFAPDDDVELHAKWSGMICRKAISLNTETCNLTGSSGCSASKFHTGDTITYGNIVNSDTFNSGDALDCDVDGNGFNERFYYVRTVDDKAVLISNHNFNGTDPINNNLNYNYDVALTKLPTTSQWNNLPVTFDGYAARLITVDDLKETSGKTNLTSTGALEDVYFLFENSKYSGLYSRSTSWVKETEEGTRYRYRNDSRNIETADSGSNNCVRPVIEVPLNLIEDDYIIKFEPNGGTIPAEYARVIKGTAIGTLPTPVKSDYTFDGWYKESSFTHKIDENTKPDGYNTYYAHWIIPVSEADLAKNSFVLGIGESDDIIINNVSELEAFTFTSNNPTIASVDSDGVITALSEGITTITITGLSSGTTKTVDVEVGAVVTDYTVSFDEQGGEPVSDMLVPKNTAIGPLPTTTKTDYVFGGWFTNTNYSVEVTPNTIIDNNKTFYAKWIPEDAVAEVNNRFFTSIQDAIDDNTETTKTVKVLKDVTMSSYIDLYDKNTEKNIVLDLNGHTITNNTTQTIRTKTSLEVKNGTVKCGSSNGAIDIETNGNLYINNTRVEQTATGSNGRAAIYNKGGTVVIGENMYITSNALWTSTGGRKRGTVQNVSGTMTILGGTIINNRNDNTSYALSIEAGTVTIGAKDGIYDTESIVMQADQGGIYANANFSLYDGMIMGKTAAVNNESKITSIEDNATKVNDSADGFNRLYYTIGTAKYKITLDPNGGEVNPTYISVDVGDRVGTLPTPTKSIYTFDGWYDGNTLVDENTIPDGPKTYVARWHYEASDTIHSFNMNNDAMNEYFNKIALWSSDETTFKANMDANFNNNNCICRENTCTGGTTKCDKPKGYETGISGILLYTSDENTKVKGDLVDYVTITSDGTIYNMIPGETYYWELDGDSTVHGYVKASGNRRILNVEGTSGVGNLRDLGGLPVDTNNDGTIDGTLKYGKIFRGERLYNDTNNPKALKKLGVDEEIDLRASSEIPSTEAQMEDFKHREIKHYQIDFETQRTNYDLARNMAIEAMQDVIDGKDIYFHCRIGTDRTGTLAYILEGLLGVPREEMYEDYELSYFYGLYNRTRQYCEDPNSSVSKTEKFCYMRDSIDDDGGVYEWFLQGSTDRQTDIALINQFRGVMINSN